MPSKLPSPEDLASATTEELLLAHRVLKAVTFGERYSARHPNDHVVAESDEVKRFYLICDELLRRGPFEQKDPPPELELLTKLVDRTPNLQQIPRKKS